MNLLIKYFLVLITIPILFISTESDLPKQEDLKIFIVGNSILKNEPAPELGWEGNWGMAASSENNDFLHIYKNLLKRSKKYNSVEVNFKNISAWESNFEYNLNEYRDVNTSNYDILIVRLGENVKYSGKYYLALNKMINHFKATDTKVIITEIIWKSDDKERIHKQVAFDNGYKYVSFNDFRANHNNFSYGLYENDQVAAHPSNAGMLVIAKLLFDTTIHLNKR